MLEVQNIGLARICDGITLLGWCAAIIRGENKDSQGLIVGESEFVYRILSILPKEEFNVLIEKEETIN